MNASEFLERVQVNPFNRAILERLAQLDVPQVHLVAGSLFQTIWNQQANCPETQDIKDYDIFYFDSRDVSYDAEDRVIQRASQLFGDLDVTVEVRNQARVHLWSERRFGQPCPELTSTRSGIDRFLILATCVGITPAERGGFEVYAPHGFSDLTGGLLRPNPVHRDRTLFLAKARSYQARWPWLQVVDVPPYQGRMRPR